MVFVISVKKMDAIDVETNGKLNEIIVFPGETLSEITNNYYIAADHKVIKTIINRYKKKEEEEEEEKKYI